MWNIDDFGEQNSEPGLRYENKCLNDMKNLIYWWQSNIYLANSRKTKMQMPMVEPRQGLQMQTGMKESAKIKLDKLKSNIIFLP